jgi:glycogen operon protein
MPRIVNPGRSSPLGATIADGGVNFSVFSRNATAIELLLFEREDDLRPSHVIPLDPVISRSYHYWHTFVPDIETGQLYGYRVRGQFDPLAERASMPTRSCSILTDAAWLSRGTIPARPPATRGTTAPLP